MEEEQENEQYSKSLFADFPDIDETSLSCLNPLPPYDESTYFLYNDLFDSNSDDPLVPSITSQDQFMVNIAQIRSLVSYIGFLQYSGGFNIDSYSEIVVKSINKFFEIHPIYSATMIQRFWRAKRKGAKKEDKIKFGIAMIVRPSNGRNQTDKQMRKQIIDDILNIPV